MSFKDWVKKTLKTDDTSVEEIEAPQDVGVFVVGDEDADPQGLKTVQDALDNLKTAAKNPPKFKAPTYGPPGVYTVEKPFAYPDSFIPNFQGHNRDDMADALAFSTHHPNFTPRKPIITAFSIDQSQFGDPKFTIEGVMGPLTTSGLKLHIPHQINPAVRNGGFDVEFDFRPPRPVIQAVESVLGDVMGIPLENENEILLETLRDIMKTIKTIFPWVNPKHDITLSLGSCRASCRVSLDPRHQIRVSVQGYDANQVDGGDPVNHILIAYYKNKEVIKQKSIRPLESDIIGCLSVIRSLYPTVPDNALEVPLFKPFIHDGGDGITSQLSTVFHSNGVRIAHGEVFYMNPMQTSVCFPASWKGNWHHAYNQKALRRLSEHKTIIEYHGDDYPFLREPPDFTDGDQES